MLSRLAPSESTNATERQHHEQLRLAQGRSGERTAFPDAPFGSVIPTRASPRWNRPTEGKQERDDPILYGTPTPNARSQLPPALDTLAPEDATCESAHTTPPQSRAIQTRLHFTRCFIAQVQVLQGNFGRPSRPFEVGTKKWIRPQPDEALFRAQRKKKNKKKKKKDHRSLACRSNGEVIANVRAEGNGGAERQRPWLLQFPRRHCFGR